ncbi:hypothetical protein PC114_g10825 [Phytophthora cactorum]|nr:hypothetical protein PC114_g10825 [Phytophthora cactorum]KAG3168346.1 hypothetical protein C6341_g11341 [Phytophthora cactorum]
MRMEEEGSNDNVGRPEDFVVVVRKKKKEKRKQEDEMAAATKRPFNPLEVEAGWCQALHDRGEGSCGWSLTRPRSGDMH